VGSTNTLFVESPRPGAAAARAPAIAGVHGAILAPLPEITSSVEPGQRTWWAAPHISSSFMQAGVHGDVAFEREPKDHALF
jgi:hypothetical protein